MIEENIVLKLESQNYEVQQKLIFHLSPIMQNMKQNKNENNNEMWKKKQDTLH